jgi:hypothetical protein
MDAGRKKKWVAWAVAAAIFVVLMLVTPAIPQNEAYHDFADQRTLFLGTVPVYPLPVTTTPRACLNLPAPRPRLSA